MAGRVVGTGEVRSETRDLQQFSALELVGTGELIVQQADRQNVVVLAQGNLLDLITTEVSGERLIIGTRYGSSFESKSPIRFLISMIHIRDLFVPGSGTMTVEGLRGDEVLTDIGGSATVALSGAVDKQELRISGSGNYDARRLLSRVASVDIPGSGNVTMRASEELHVSIAGSGDVTYFGDPRVEQHITGSGRVSRGE